jgi:hypothetical protein
VNDKAFIQDGTVTSLVKKARRATLFRNIGISLVVSLLVLAGGFLGSRQLLGKSADDALRDIALFKQISGPNVHEAGYRINFGLFSGTLEYQTYKLVEGIPVAWNQETFEFNALGSVSRLPGNYSSIQLPDPAMKDFHYQRPFNPQTGQREMLFYLPGIDYGHYLNDLASLNEIGSGRYVEMAISFDKSYTAAQINAMLPEGVHPVWYWVDTYYDKEAYTPKTVVEEQKMPDGSIKQVERVTPPTPDSARDVYGFDANMGDSEEGQGTEKDFLRSLENGLTYGKKYYAEYKKIYDYLKGGKEKPTERDVKILGVVVTGSPDSLKALQGQPYVKAAVLGAVVDKY